MKRLDTSAFPSGKAKTIVIIVVAILAVFAVVIATFPAPYLTDIDPTLEKNQVTNNAPFQLHFSQKMDKNSVEAAFKLSPKIEGEFKWPDSKILEFHPKKELKIEDEYQLTLAASAKSIWRKKMGVESSLAYVVSGPPFLLFNDPPAGSFIKKNGKITVMFDRPMDFQDIPKEKLLQITPEIPGEIRLMGQSAFQFIPETLEAGQNYEIKLPAGLPSADGGKGQKEKIWTLRSPKNTITKTAPQPEEIIDLNRPLEIHFDRPIDLGQIKPGKNALLFPSNDLAKSEGDEEKKEDGFFNTEVRYGQNENGERLNNVLIFTPAFPYQAQTIHQFVLKADPELGLEEDAHLSFNTTSGETIPEPMNQNDSKEKILEWELDQQVQFFVQGEKPVLRLKKPLPQEVTLSLCPLSSDEYIRTQANGSFENYSCPEAGITLKTDEEKTSQTIDLNTHFERKWTNGVYFTSLKTETERIWMVFLIQDTSLLLKKTHQDLLVWANDIDSGKPLAETELEFLSPDGTILETVKTDKNGLYFGEDILAEGIWARVKEQDNQEMKPWGIVSEHWTPSVVENRKPSSQGKILLFTNQNQFKPGEQLLMAGLYREKTNHQLVLPTEIPVNVSLKDQYEQVVINQAATINPDGSFQAKLDLPLNIMEGQYQVMVRDVNGLVLNQNIMIEIGSHSKSLRFEWTNQQEVYSANSIPQMVLKARQENGIALPKLKASYKLFKTPLKKSFSSKPEYTFGNIDPECEEECDKNLLIKEGKIEFDTKGEAKIDLTDKENSFLPASQFYTMEIISEEDDEQTTRLNFAINQGQFDIGIKLSHAIVAGKENIEAEFIALNSTEETMNLKNISVSLLDPKERNRAIYKKNLAPQENQPLALSIPVQREWTDGIYILKAEAEDEFKNTIETEKEIYLTNGDNEALANNFFLAPDQSSYRVGGRADLIVNEEEASSQTPVRAVLSYERDGVMEYKSLNLKTPITKVSIPIEEYMFPYFDVSLIKFKAGFLPEYEKTQIRLNVEDENSDVQLEMEIKPEQPKAGDRIQLIVKSRDSKGQAIPASLNMSIIEGEAEYPEISYKSFFDSNFISAQEASNVNLLPSEAKDQKNPMTSSGKKFSSVYFNPLLKTDEKGIATVDLKLPEEAVNLHYYLAASAETKKFGFKQGSLSLNSQLIIEPLLPSFVMAGDQTQLGASIKNISSEEVNTKIEVKVSDASMQGERTQSVFLRPGEQMEIKFPIVINEEINVQDLTFSFHWDGKSLSGKIPVKHLTFIQDIVENGFIKEIWSGRITRPKEAYPRTGWLHFSLSSGAASSLNNFTRRLEADKDGSNYALYNELRKRLVLDSAEKSGDQESLKILMNELIKKSTPEGAYYFWNENYPDPIFTAKIVEIYALAKKIGLEVNEDSLKKSLSYLLNSLADVDLSLQDQIFIMWTLGQHDQHDTERSLNIFKQRSQLNMIGKAYLLMNLEDLRKAGQVAVEPFVEKIKTEIVSEAVNVEDKLYFTEPKKNILATSLVLYGLLQSSPDQPIIDKVMRYLVSQKSKWNADFDVEEMNWLLRALKVYSKERVNTYSSNFIAQVKLQGTLIIDQSIVNQAKDEIHEIQQKASILNEQNVNDLFVVKEGAGDLFFDAQLTSYLNPLQSQANEKGVILTRSLEGQKDAMSFKQGDSYMNRLEIIVPKDLHEVIIETPHPAGMRILRTLKLNPDSPFDKIQFTDSGLRFMATVLPAGVYELEYETQAILAGSYHQLPATLKSLKEPNIYAQTLGALVSIVE